jgi:Rnl2 family RNA ligase
MEYNGYNKIDTKISEKNISNIKKWCVTEKVHGSCFCFIYNMQNNNILYAKRKSILLDSEYFFGYRDILPYTIKKINKIIEYIKKNIKENINLIDIKYINIYGELFGGSYLNIESKYKPVQCGIYYSPDIHFYAFDISLINIDNKEKYLDFEFSILAFEYSQILYAKPLKYFSSYEKACDYKIGFNTTIPKIFNLPELKDNKAEGIIVRSMKNHIMIKIKIQEFAEIKYSDNNYIETDNTIINYTNKAEKYITKNRLNNAISKIGDFNELNSQEIYQLCADDILYEINAFHIVELQELREWIIQELKKINLFNNN